MKLFKRKGIYYCQYVNPSGKRIRFTTHLRNKQEAINMALKRISEPMTALDNSFDVLTLLSVTKSRERSLEHSKYYKNCYRYHRQLIEYFTAHLNLYELKPTDVLQYHSY